MFSHYINIFLFHKFLTIHAHVVTYWAFQNPNFFIVLFKLKIKGIPWHLPNNMELHWNARDPLLYSLSIRYKSVITFFSSLYTFVYVLKASGFTELVLQVFWGLYILTSAFMCICCCTQCSEYIHVCILFLHVIVSVSYYISFFVKTYQKYNTFSMIPERCFCTKSSIY